MRRRRAAERVAQPPRVVLSLRSTCSRHVAQCAHSPQHVPRKVKMEAATSCSSTHRAAVHHMACRCDATHCASRSSRDSAPHCAHMDMGKLQAGTPTASSLRSVPPHSQATTPCDKGTIPCDGTTPQPGAWHARPHVRRHAPPNHALPHARLPGRASRPAGWREPAYCKEPVPRAPCLASRAAHADRMRTTRRAPALGGSGAARAAGHAARHGGHQPALFAVRRRLGRLLLALGQQVSARLDLARGTRA